MVKKRANTLRDEEGMVKAKRRQVLVEKVQKVAKQT
jgi:hypothetical protein